MQKNSPSLQPEISSGLLRFLIACCQAEPAEYDLNFIHAYLSEMTDDRSLITTAATHGVLPLVYKTLSTLSPNNRQISNHQSLITALKQHYMQIAQRNMLMSAELMRILKRLQQNGIEALAFKGPALAQLAYGDITLRQFGDLDILVNISEKESAAETLMAEGYVAALAMTPAQEKRWFRHVKDLVLYHPRKNILIEMHWLLQDNDYPFLLDHDPLFDRSQSIIINNQKIQTFSNEDLLIYLCIHGAKHLFERIGWIKDIDILIRSKRINWDIVAALGNQRGVDRMLQLGFTLSHQYFRTPIQGRFIKVSATQKWLIRTNVFIANNWEQRYNMIHNTATMLHLFPATSMKLQYLYKVIIKPSRSEYMAVDLPASLYWLYYLIRPYLLVKKYLGFK